MSLYPDGRCCRVNDAIEARKYFETQAKYNRKVLTTSIVKKSALKYISATYIMQGGSLYVTYDTSRLGKVYLPVLDSYEVNYHAGKESLEIPWNLQPDLISSHLAAIRRILAPIPPCFPIEIVTNEYSVYMALTAYDGNASTVKRVKELFELYDGVWIAYRKED